MLDCQQWTFNDSPWLKSRWFQTFPTVLVDRRLLGSLCCFSTGLVANGIRLTKRCNALSSRSDVTRGLQDLGLCVFSHKSVDYSLVVAHLTFNSFEGHPCCMHADYLPSLCFWYSSSYHAYWEWIILFKHRTWIPKFEAWTYWIVSNAWEAWFTCMTSRH